MLKILNRLFNKEPHRCQSESSDDNPYIFDCYEYTDGKLYLGANGEYECEVKYCPFCGYRK